MDSSPGSVEASDCSLLKFSRVIEALRDFGSQSQWSLSPEQLRYDALPSVDSLSTIIVIKEEIMLFRHRFVFRSSLFVLLSEETRDPILHELVDKSVLLLGLH